MYLFAQSNVGWKEVEAGCMQVDNGSVATRIRPLPGGICNPLQRLRFAMQPTNGALLTASDMVLSDLKGP